MKKIIIPVIIFLLILFNIDLIAQKRYYKAQAHCHTTNSDGNLTPEEVIQEYKNRGYEVVFFTDHNYATCGAAYSLPDILAITGNEYTFDKHINGLFQTHTVNATGFTTQQAIDSIKAQGGLAMFNHPMVKVPHNWWLPANEIVTLEGLDFIEIFNAGTEFYAQDDHQLWDSLLTMGYKLYGVATDDLHVTHYMGIQLIDKGWIMIYMDELSEEAVYEAMINGDFYASTGIELSHYYIDEQTIHVGCINCSRITFIGENQTILETIGSQTATYAITDEYYVRVQLENVNDNKKAWTQPVFYDDLPYSVQNSINNNIIDFRFFPNPTNDYIFVCVQLNKIDNITVQIIDLLGKTHLEHIEQISKKGNNVFKFDVSGLNTGIYFIRVCTSNKCSVSKINIQ